MSETKTLPAEAPLGRPLAERFSGPAPLPMAKGARIDLREGMQVDGFMPTEWRERLPFRWIGPEPEALLVLGEIDAGVGGFLLTFLAPADPAPLGPISVRYQGRELELSAGTVPDRAAHIAGAWALLAALPPVEELARPSWGRLELRFERTLPEDPAAPARWVGLALNSVELVG
jgi:hypothetical protein